ncbi:hypothetical protein LIS77_02745 [Cytobacillus firmus]|uniref:hypothetical protein n=1 Tax=Cytobacillus firmus TaxID=1399 RepID=UPI002079B776|nr:hypothetical protein [Cytobacillus firmus]USK39468.1 hypothetical protein LIS77_02745 [Cytobacillus firmus]
MQEHRGTENMAMVIRHNDEDWVSINIRITPVLIQTIFKKETSMIIFYLLHTKANPRGFNFMEKTT